MRFRVAAAVTAVVSVVVLSTGPGLPGAEAASLGRATFSGVFTLGPPALPTVGVSPATPWGYGNQTCVEVASHVGKAKPNSTAGGCALVVGGVLTGSCVAAVGTGAGAYIDSLAQVVGLSFVMVVEGLQFHWTGTATKGGQVIGTFTAVGGWVVAGAACGVVGTGAQLAYTVA
ncbi:MAG TPA: hypothetical protein VGB03_08125 [Acidimicrobiales bacterium]|jgi:hypothetical protein